MNSNKKKKEKCCAWIRTTDSPIPYNEIVVAGLYVLDNYINKSIFERYIIYRDEETGDLFNGEGQLLDYQDAWDVESYTHWHYLPEEPSEL